MPSSCAAQATLRLISSLRGALGASSGKAMLLRTLRCG